MEYVISGFKDSESSKFASSMPRWGRTARVSIDMLPSPVLSLLIAACEIRIVKKLARRLSPVVVYVSLPILISLQPAKSFV